MYRKNILILAGVLLASAFAALPAAARQSGSATGQRVFKSSRCNAKVSRYNAPSWACTTITVNPWQLASGDMTTATYQFRAKKTLKFVSLCFGNVSTTKAANCAYKHNYRKIKRGRVISRAVQIQAPAETSSGDYRLFDNYTHFYKKQKWVVVKEAYWPANSYVCIIATSQPDYQCSG